MVILDLLSGSTTPLESVPVRLQEPCSSHRPPNFVTFAQAVLYNAAGLDIVWPQLAALVGFTAVFLGISLVRF